MKEIHARHPINAEFHAFSDWDRFLVLKDDIKSDDNLIIVLNRKNSLSYNSAMDKIPFLLDSYFKMNNCLIIYPTPTFSWQEEQLDLTNPSFLEAIEKVDFIGKTIAGIFRKK